ncbi:VanZ family protein [Hallella colorans]|uniref:VanZ family protein n=1 Tax=Hallella colorans TaxID=1703337 RepID=UPI0023F46F4F|nr:VanZ family protein [Hallella colorans]
MKIGNIIRHYPLSCLVIVTIWTLCLIPIPETPLSNVSMIDKWTHIVMYGVFCAILLTEYGQRHKHIRWSQIIVGAVILPIAMGGLIEIVQATCTGGNRSGDIYDFLADTLGVLLGAAIGTLLARYLSKRHKD